MSDQKTNDLGGIAWEAYRQKVGRISQVNRQPLPTWEQLKLDAERASIVEGWNAAAQAVAEHIEAGQPETQPEKKKGKAK